MYSETIIKLQNKHNKIAILCKWCYKDHMYVLRYLKWLNKNDIIIWNRKNVCLFKYLTIAVGSFLGINLDLWLFSVFQEGLKFGINVCILPLIIK